MTEAEWLACDDPQPMLAFLQGRASNRKLRLFACACCRDVWRLLTNERGRSAVEIAEQFADGLAGDGERSAARRLAQQAAQVRGTTPTPTDPKWERRAAASAYWSLARDAVRAALGATDLVLEALILEQGGYTAPNSHAVQRNAQLRQASFLRDIFGNPFRPVTFDPAWRTSDVMPLANGIYADRAFDRMPILADALQDAGCDSEEILSHCRDTNTTHIRGCWVVDMVLGKE